MQTHPTAHVHCSCIQSADSCMALRCSSRCLCPWHTAKNQNKSIATVGSTSFPADLKRLCVVAYTEPTCVPMSGALSVSLWVSHLVLVLWDLILMAWRSYQNSLVTCVITDISNSPPALLTRVSSPSQDRRALCAMAGPCLGKMHWGSLGKGSRIVIVSAPSPQIPALSRKKNTMLVCSCSCFKCIFSSGGGERDLIGFFCLFLSTFWF